MAHWGDGRPGKVAFGSTRLTLAQSCELDPPHPAWPEKEFSVSNFGFWFCVSTSHSSGAGRPQRESQQVAG